MARSPELLTLFIGQRKRNSSKTLPHRSFRQHSTSSNYGEGIGGVAPSNNRTSNYVHVPMYQVSHDSSLVNRPRKLTGLGLAKKRVRWCFGYSNYEALKAGYSGPMCRGEEHVIEFEWSISSGKRRIRLDHEIVYDAIEMDTSAQDFHYDIRVKGKNHKLQLHARLSPSQSHGNNANSYGSGNNVTLKFNDLYFGELPYLGDVKQDVFSLYVAVRRNSRERQAHLTPRKERANSNSTGEGNLVEQGLSSPSRHKAGSAPRQESKHKSRSGDHARGPLHASKLEHAATEKSSQTDSSEISASMAASPAANLASERSATHINLHQRSGLHLNRSLSASLRGLGAESRKRSMDSPSHPSKSKHANPTQSPSETEDSAREEELVAQKKKRCHNIENLGVDNEQAVIKLMERSYSRSNSGGTAGKSTSSATRKRSNGSRRSRQKSRDEQARSGVAEHEFAAEKSSSRRHLGSPSKMISSKSLPGPRKKLSEDAEKVVRTSRNSGAVAAQRQPKSSRLVGSKSLHGTAGSGSRRALEDREERRRKRNERKQNVQHDTIQEEDDQDRRQQLKRTSSGKKESSHGLAVVPASKNVRFEVDDSPRGDGAVTGTEQSGGDEQSGPPNHAVEQQNQPPSKMVSRAKRAASPFAMGVLQTPEYENPKESSSGQDSVSNFNKLSISDDGNHQRSTPTASVERDQRAAAKSKSRELDISRSSSATARATSILTGRNTSPMMVTPEELAPMDATDELLKAAACSEVSSSLAFSPKRSSSRIKLNLGKLGLGVSDDDMSASIGEDLYLFQNSNHTRRGVHVSSHNFDDYSSSCCSSAISSGVHLYSHSVKAPSPATVEDDDSPRKPSASLSKPSDIVAKDDGKSVTDSTLSSTDAKPHPHDMLLEHTSSSELDGNAERVSMGAEDEEEEDFPEIRRPVCLPYVEESTDTDDAVDVDNGTARSQSTNGTAVKDALSFLKKMGQDTSKFEQRRAKIVRKEAGRRKQQHHSHHPRLPRKPRNTATATSAV